MSGGAKKLMLADHRSGAADKIHGTVIECDDKSKYALARKEPIGVCAQICPWVRRSEAHSVSSVRKS